MLEKTLLRITLFTIKQNVRLEKVEQLTKDSTIPDTIGIQHCEQEVRKWTMINSSNISPAEYKSKRITN
ncbi:hypothetical protein Bca4012_058711 [Brassica carinata]